MATMLFSFVFAVASICKARALSCRRIRISGLGCENGYGKKLNQVYEYKGNTRDGRPYFCGETSRACMWHDKECDGDDNPHPIWMVSTRKPQLHRDKNLDGSDEGCHNDANIGSREFEPPLGKRQWDWVYCDGHGCSGRTVCLTCMDANATDHRDTGAECVANGDEECHDVRGNVIAIIIGIIIAVCCIGAIIIGSVVGFCFLQQWRRQTRAQMVFQPSPVAGLQVIQVQCPPGVSAGQSLQVQDPRTGQLMSAVVPSGVTPGGTFQIQAPAVPATVVGTPVVGQPVANANEMNPSIVKAP